MMIKNLATNDSYNWYVYHKDVNGFLVLNNNSGYQAGGPWAGQLPDANNIYLNNDPLANGEGQEYIGYLFTDSNEKVKTDNYVASTSSQGIVTGFRPGWVMIKNKNTNANWYIFDRQRGNVSISANATGGGDTISSFSWADNGFQLSSFDSYINTQNNEYIYIAVADEPMASKMPPKGALVSNANSDEGSMVLSSVTGAWTTGMTAKNETQRTNGAPDPDYMEFVSSTPAGLNGATITDWTNATWTVTNKDDNDSTQSETKAIVPNQLQTLKPSNITLTTSTNYEVTVKYEAADSISATSFPNSFKTSYPYGWTPSSTVPSDWYGLYATVAYNNSTGTGSDLRMFFIQPFASSDRRIVYLDEGSNTFSGGFGVDGSSEIRAAVIHPYQNG